MPDLGRYALEVLGAYGLTLALLGALVLASLRQSRGVRRALEQIEAQRDMAKHG